MHPFHVNVELRLDESAAKSVAELFSQAITMAIAQCPNDFEPKAVLRLRASQHANLRGQKPPDDLGLLVDAKETAKLLQVSPRKLWDMYNSGQMPAPIRIGRVLRWSIEVLKKWIDAGCPNQHAGKE